MPILNNQRHEAFAQGLAKGLTSNQAYIEAGYKPNRCNAGRLKTNENIQARFEELVEAGAERAEIDIARTLKELVRIGTSDIRQALTPNGALLNPLDWDDDFAAAVSSIEVVTNTGDFGKDADGRKVVDHTHKIKMWDKNSALEKIAKHLGMFVEKVQHSGEVGVRVIDYSKSGPNTDA
ncbi:MAG: terminase small subunit [Alphaproteobacteria bacterium]|nr:terminase small subunit [Alphaproteobacteria bacterium]